MGVIVGVAGTCGRLKELVDIGSTKLDLGDLNCVANMDE